MQSRGPDSMHTVAGDVKAVFSMLNPVASDFDGSKGETNYRIEVEMIGRWRGGFPVPADAGGAESSATAQV